ncbi:MAG: S8 family serine peptidase [Candidatus Kapabacteria bacterium]|nr:S8 family serine peptidase [Candidatus Kapabacteria bacterium]
MKTLTAVAVFLSATLVSVAQLTYLPAEPPRRMEPVVAGMLKIRLSPDAAVSASGVLASMGLRIVRPLLPFEQSLRFRTKTSEQTKIKSVETALRIEDRLLRSYLISYENLSIPPERMIAMLHVGCGPFECASPWCVMQLMGEPNDPQRDRQKLLQTIRAYDAWDVESGSDTVVIGISDSGLRQEHEDLKDALYVRKTEIEGNRIDDDNNGYVDDYRGYNFCATPGDSTYGNTFNPNNSHGTGVGGLCGATVDNSIGIAGIAHNCKIFPLRTMPDNSTGIVYGYESLIYCAVNEFDVVNCSWGGFSRSCIDEACIDGDIIAYTIARGTAVVAAAGNHGTAAPFYPASYPGVLGVGVVDPQDNVIPMSASGPTVDVMAPGHDSWTTGNDGAYFGFCCTSGSSPIASAIVALVRSKYPELGPLEACAVVREAVDEHPWKNVPPNTDPLLLPRGRVNALAAVTIRPDTVVSIVVDTVAIAAVDGGKRWTIGDTVLARVTLTNTLAPWKISEQSAVTLAGRLIPGIHALGGSTALNIDASKGQNVVLAPIAFVVDVESDTAVYAVSDLTGQGLSGSEAKRSFSFSVTPSPAYTTLTNPHMLVSIGDRGRIGNTDIQRGQGDGLTYKNFCGQLYEGGLMVYANGRVVDAIRARKGVNDHFHPIKRFMQPDASRGVVRDDDAPDSLRIGVEVEQIVRLDTSTATLVIDVTITNMSSTTLNDLSAAWFYDWDLGEQPAKNRTWKKEGDAQVVQSTLVGQPVVLLRSTSRYEDGQPIVCGIDNTTTYSGFTTARKIEIFQHPDTVQYSGENDVSAIAGMRFSSPVPAGHRRSFRHVIAIDTSLEGAEQAAQKILEAPTPTDTLISRSTELVFPNPGSDVVYVSVGQIQTSAPMISVFDAAGRVVLQRDVTITAGAYIQPLEIRSLAIGTYEIRLTDGSVSRSWSLVVVR